MSYDYGVTINAFAKCFAVRAFDTVELRSSPSADDLRALFHLYLGYYFDLDVNAHSRQPNTIFSGNSPLSFSV
jgi:hypothetical protein